MRELILFSALSIPLVVPAFGQVGVETDVQTWYDDDTGLPFHLYRDKDGHWRGWDENRLVDMRVNGSWWHKWAEGTIGGIGAECYPDWLLHMNCQ